ncbi:unnamed protein product [Brassica rapa]|uniref:DUF676 domain-containing protein n=1 Tax=Brassica campestris TaxID=3711 RepID=A0A3P6CCQ7_BRACM|nr:unnamed protein product [Brassica rapa]VDD16153.1 unnamed protein product [Brassica rapa]
MERWSSVLKIPLIATSSNYYRVAASLCLSVSIALPSANAVFFHGDRVRDTGNTVIERLYDLRKVAEVIVSKFGNSVNAWVVEASVFNGPFAVYKDFVPLVNRYGEPTASYSPIGFPASSSIVYLLSSFLQESRVLKEGKDVYWRSSLADSPRTILLGFSKGGVVMNQFLSEMSSLDTNSASEHEKIGTIPASKDSFLKSISEVHYIDVGLNSSGAYITDQNVVQRISQRLTGGGGSSVSVFVHGTPRQWRDEQRGWIVKEKDELVRLLKSEGENSGGKLQVHERFYFADRVPDLQMHFEIIDVMDVSSA